MEAQVRVLYRRCQYLRWAIAFTTLSMLCIFIMISCLFFQQFYSLPLEGVIKVSFLLNKIVMVRRWSATFRMSASSCALSKAISTVK